MSDNDILTAIEEVRGDEENMGVIAYMFSNDRKNGAKRLQPFLDMFYSGVYQNTIGVMEAKNSETGEVELVLVGLQHVGEDTLTFPIAKILDHSTSQVYLSPDGKGGWIDAPMIEFDEDEDERTDPE